MANKEDKFFVLKLEDLHEYLTPEGRAQLDEISNYISAMRKQSGREPHPRYVVCNQDEPYANAVWDAILKGEDAKVSNVKLRG
jgi:hypothetical protein